MLHLNHVKCVCNALTAHFTTVQLGDPATREQLTQLTSAVRYHIGDLCILYSVCNGIDIDLEGWNRWEGVFGATEDILATYPIEDIDSIPQVRLLVPILDNQCGDYHCLVTGQGLGSGCVILWDHEEAGHPLHILAGSLALYLHFWSDSLICRYDRAGRPRPHAEHPWPDDPNWICDHDDHARYLFGVRDQLWRDWG